MKFRFFFFCETERLKQDLKNQNNDVFEDINRNKCLIILSISRLDRIYKESDLDQEGKVDRIYEESDIDQQDKEQRRMLFPKFKYISFNSFNKDIND